MGKIVFYVELQTASSSLHGQPLSHEVLQSGQISVTSISSAKIRIVGQIVYRIKNDAAASSLNRQTLVLPMVDGALSIAPVNVHDVDINSLIKRNIEHFRLRLSG